MTTRPKAGQRTSRAGVELIKTFEGFRPRAARLPDGRFVVGYGHTQSAREGVRIAEADAHALLIYDLLTVEAAINEWVFAPLTQNQFDALVWFEQTKAVTPLPAGHGQGMPETYPFGL